MGSKDEIVPQLILMGALAFLVGIFVGQKGMGFLGLLLLVLVFFLGRRMIRPLQSRQEEVQTLVRHFGNEDWKQIKDFKPTTTIGLDLKDSVLQLTEKQKSKLRQIELKDNFLKNIVQHAGVGIITLRQGGEVDIINTEAKRLLDLTYLSNINELSEKLPLFVEKIASLKTGGRTLLSLPHKEGNLPVSVFVIELMVNNEVVKLISLQNIQYELDEKEMEAWQNLIRILTHEIMNSVTPISSLASTIEEDLQKHLEADGTLDKDESEDIMMGIKTIHRRSKGLISFVSDFRNLTRVPNPIKKPTMVKEMVEEVLTLMKPDIDQANIKVELSLNPEKGEIELDKEQITQVLINLVKNAIEALKEHESSERKLIIGYRPDEDQHSEITVEDNGPGIEEEALNRIFIPFFTTKKSGSGIGLSLSKQIMRKHDGNIYVRSQLNKGTKITLRF